MNAHDEHRQPVTVHVDVIGPGRALIVSGSAQARVGVDGARYYVEDADTEQPIGHARSYRAAGELFARHHGLSSAAIEVQHES